MIYLIDTNVLSELPKRRPDPAVIEWFAAQTSLAFSAVTLEELTYGIARAQPEQAQRLERWLQKLLAIPPVIVPVDERVAHIAGRLRAERDRAGRAVAQADMLIAACALLTGSVLVTRNVSDFEGCGVPVLNPFPTKSKD